MRIIIKYDSLYGEVKKISSQLTNEAFGSPNHKTHFNFTLVCLWNVQIRILNQPNGPVRTASTKIGIGFVH